VACNKAIEVCKAQGKSIVKLALQYAMRNHDIATTLVGMNSIEQVQENVKAAIEVEQGAKYDEELLEEVEKVLQPVKNLTWSSGRDENN
jgi:L-galactose dehydrogenase